MGNVGKWKSLLWNDFIARFHRAVRLGVLFHVGYAV